MQYFLALLLQFSVIVADRAIYLRSSIKAKFWLQLVHVLVFHALIFYALPLWRGEA